MKKFLMFLLALAVFLPSTAYADDSPMGGQGETVYPIKNTDIAMLHEEIDIVLSGARTTYTCHFTFHNTGEYAKVLVGFPNWARTYKEFEPELKNDYAAAALHGFKTWVDGKRVRVYQRFDVKNAALMKDYGYYPVWYTWNVWFKKDQKKEVTNTYWTHNEGGNLTYILNTGANWKGNIGKAVIRMKLKGIDPSLLYYDYSYTYPPDYMAEDGTLTWDLRDIEPDRDVSVSIWQLSFDAFDEAWGQDGFWEGDEGEMGSPGSASDDGSVPAFSVLSTRLASTAQDEGPLVYELQSYKSLLRLESHFNQQHYRSVLWWGERIRRLYKKEKQPQLLHYYMGVAYYKRNMYKNALKELNQSGAVGLYYKALCLKKLDKTEEYRQCLKEMAGKNRCFGLALWGKSRLMDLDGQ